MTRTVQFLAISVGASALLACSSSSGRSSGQGSSSESGSGSGSSHESSGTSTSQSSLASFCSSFLDTEAALFSHCYGGPTSEWETLLGGPSPCTKLEAAVAAGRITFNASEAAGCLAAYGNVTCATMSTETSPSACLATLSGTVTDGSTCYSTADCVAGSFCSGLGGASGSCSGTCKAEVAAGMACGTGDQCVTGYVCEVSASGSGSGTGATATCTAIATPTYASLNEACGYQASTKTIVPCAGGLVCNAVTDTCVDRVALGATCTPGAGECVSFAYCDPTSKTCKADPTAGGKCGAEKGEDLITCTGQSYCKASASTPNAGTCTALGGTGAACSADADCLSTFCSVADGGVGTCLPACTEE